MNGTEHHNRRCIHERLVDEAMVATAEATITIIIAGGITSGTEVIDSGFRCIYGHIWHMC